MDYVEINRHTGERQVRSYVETRTRIAEVYKHMGHVGWEVDADRAMRRLEEGHEWEAGHQWIRGTGDAG